jgi:hypothetical protein
MAGTTGREPAASAVTVDVSEVILEKERRGSRDLAPNVSPGKCYRTLIAPRLDYA